MLVERAMAAEGRANMRPVVEKELLHYDILFALDQGGLLEPLTFQGGTCLRLCYGSPRLSEDLDFVGGKDFTTSTLLDMKRCIEKNIGERYGLEVSVTEPKEMAKEPEYQNIKINKWRVSVTTSPEKRNLPRQKIKIEVGNIAAYSRIPRAVQQNYDFLPDGYSDMLVMTETLDEVMADKLISLVNCQKYVRHRDIWDLRWLKQQNAKIIPNYIKAKIQDYHITDYLENLDKMIERLDDIIKGPAFFNEMSRFLPMDVQERTLKKENFKQFLILEIQGLLLETKQFIT